MADDTSNRGFASMDDSLQEEISRKGGEATGGNKKTKASGRGSNLSKEDRVKGGKHSHGGGGNNR